MKIMRRVFAGLIVLAGVVALYSFGGGYKYAGGSPAGYTGSPFDNKNCVQCHGGSVGTVVNWITSDVPAEGYTPGQTYLISVNVSGSGKKGFLVSPHDLQGNLLGVIQAGSGCKLVGSGKYITQAASTSANPAVWSFQWTAPSDPVAEITFYGAFTVGKSVTKLSTMTIVLNTTAIAERNISTGAAYPNPVRSSVFSLPIKSTYSGSIRVFLYDIKGRKIASLYDGKVIGGEDLIFNRENSWLTGVYILSIEANENICVQKLIFD